MDFSLPADLWCSVIPISLAVGAVGGLAWDIGNAVRQSKSDPKTGLDNTIELPRVYKDESGSLAVDLGVLGPMLVGAVAGVLLVLLIGPQPPSAEEVAKAVTAVSAAGPATAEATASVEENLPSKVAATQLVILALFGGLGGWGLLQTLTTKMSSLLEASIEKAFSPTKKAVEETTQVAAVKRGVPEADAEEIGKAAGESLEEAAGTALRPAGPSTETG